MQMINGERNQLKDYEKSEKRDKIKRFKSNIIIFRENKFKKKKESIEDDFVLGKSATVSDIEEMIGKSRRQTAHYVN